MKEVEEELGVLQLSEVDLSKIDAKEKFLVLFFANFMKFLVVF